MTDEVVSGNGGSDAATRAADADEVPGEATREGGDPLTAVAQRLIDVPSELPARALLLDGVLASLQAELARLDHV